jgi:TPR repeat protein
MDFKSDNIELYVIIFVLFLLIWLIKDTIKFYYGEKRRVKNLHRFAKEGEIESQIELGKHYQKGKVVKKNCDRAAYWYNRAALSGDKEAKSHLEEFMKNRRGNKC